MSPDQKRHKPDNPVPMYHDGMMDVQSSDNVSMDGGASSSQKPSEVFKPDSSVPSSNLTVPQTQRSRSNRSTRSKRSDIVKLDDGSAVRLKPEEREPFISYENPFASTQPVQPIQPIAQTQPILRTPKFGTQVDVDEGDLSLSLNSETHIEPIGVIDPIGTVATSGATTEYLAEIKPPR